MPPSWLSQVRARALLLFSLSTLAFIFFGCSALPFNLPGTQGTASTPTPQPTVVTGVRVATATLEPTALIPTLAALASPTVAPPSPTRPPVVIPTLAPPAPSGAVFTRVKIFLVAINDNGKSGAKVGCGDSLVPVERQIPPTIAPLTAALKELLSLHDQYYGQSGLYNALYQSNLQVQSVAISNGVATIRLTGKMQLGGECDDPRVEAQLTSTARQFSTVRSAVIYINGAPLMSILSGKGQ